MPRESPGSAGRFAEVAGVRGPDCAVDGIDMAGLGTRKSLLLEARKQLESADGDSHVYEREHRARLSVHKERVGDYIKVCLAHACASGLPPSGSRTERPRDTMTGVGRAPARSLARSAEVEETIATALTLEQEDWLDQPLTMED